MAMEGKVSRVGSLAKQTAITSKNENVQDTISTYRGMFDEKKGGTVETRKKNYMSLVNSFYNMVTDIYEFGWGQSFHFAPRHKWESFEASIARHEMYLAHRLGLKEGDVAVDLGCGVGGPGRCMARFSHAKIVGVNNNDYQIERCKKLTADQGLSHLCSYMKADFMKIPVEDGYFDSAFHVEALVHSPDKLATFKEIYRILKPGGTFGGYDWIVTDKFDPNNKEHVRIKKEIELGNGIPDLLTGDQIHEFLKKAGFEVEEVKDVAIFDPQYEISWADSLEGKYSLSGFKHTPLGRWLTNRMVWILETLHIAPKGTLDIHNLLLKTANDLVDGATTGTFSPMLFFVARKPQ